MTAMTIIYVGCAGSREIYCFNLDIKSGDLALFDVVTVPGGDGPSPSNMPMALSSDGSMLFAALRMAPFPVSTFSIDPGNGTLVHHNIAPLPAPMAYISVAARDRFLLGASYKEGKLSVSVIAREGVEANAVQVVATPPKAHCILKGKSDGAVYATTVEGNAIMVFHMDVETGWLVEAEPHLIACRPGSGPRHLALHPQLNILYCVNELAGTLAAFAIESETGTLSEMQYETLVPPGFSGNARAADLHLTADGRFAYASVRSLDFALIMYPATCPGSDSFRSRARHAASRWILTDVCWFVQVRATTVSESMRSTPPPARLPSGIGTLLRQIQAGYKHSPCQTCRDASATQAASLQLGTWRHRTRPALVAAQRNRQPNVCFGSKADILAVHRHVRSSPKSGHRWPHL